MLVAVTRKKVMGEAVEQGLGDVDGMFHARKRVPRGDSVMQAADYLCETHRISQRRASRILGRARSTIRYRRRQRFGEDTLIKASGAWPGDIRVMATGKFMRG